MGHLVRIGRSIRWNKASCKGRLFQCFHHWIWLSELHSQYRWMGCLHRFWLKFLHNYILSRARYNLYMEVVQLYKHQEFHNQLLLGLHMLPIRRGRTIFGCNRWIRDNCVHSWLRINRNIWGQIRKNRTLCSL